MAPLGPNSGGEVAAGRRDARSGGRAQARTASRKEVEKSRRRRARPVSEIDNSSANGLASGSCGPWQHGNTQHGTGSEATSARYVAEGQTLVGTWAHVDLQREVRLHKAERALVVLGELHLGRGAAVAREHIALEELVVDLLYRARHLPVLRGVGAAGGKDVDASPSLKVILAAKVGRQPMAVSEAAVPALQRGAAKGLWSSQGVVLVLVLKTHGHQAGPLVVGGPPLAGKRAALPRGE